MQEDKQAVTFIVQAATDFRSFRVAARSPRLQCVRNDASETPIVIVKCGPPKHTVLKLIPMMNQVLTVSEREELAGIVDVGSAVGLGGTNSLSAGYVI